jgi:hypothetical protein
MAYHCLIVAGMYCSMVGDHLNILGVAPLSFSVSKNHRFPGGARKNGLSDSGDANPRRPLN